MKSILYSHVAQLSPESKMLLLLMYQNADNHKKYSKPLLDMVKQYGVSKTQILKGLAQLKELRIVEPITDTTELKKPGRPISSYQINLGCFDSRAQTVEVDLASFIVDRIQKLYLIKSRKLTLANRLLLILLISKANEAGTVDSVSSRELSHWMGCTENRIQSIVRKLRQSNLISHYIPGICHKLIGKHKAVYFLNMEMLGGYQVKINTILDVSSKDTLASLINFNAQHAVDRSSGFSGRSLEGFAYYLVSQRQLTTSIMFQIDYRLEKHFISLINQGETRFTQSNFYRKAIDELFDKMDAEHCYIQQLLNYMSSRAKQISESILHMQKQNVALKQCRYELRYKSEHERILLCIP